MKTLKFWCALFGALLCAACGGGTTTAPVTAVTVPLTFTMTNATTGNSVQAYRHDANGRLVSLGGFATGGSGVGHGLENQGALAQSGDGAFLYVVNPGSDDLSVFRVAESGAIEFADRVSSGGALPVSIAEWNGIVYVLNRHAMGAMESGPVIQGFKVSASGQLSPIPGSTLALHATDTNAAQIEISPDGLWIVVTERGINEIDIIPMLQGFVPGLPRAAPSAGGGPFGFRFSDSARLYVSEVATGTASAYALQADGTLNVLSAAVATQQRGTCWLTIAPSGDLAYVSNTSSSSISSFQIAPDGSLKSLISVAATTSGKPLDVIVSEDGNYLSVLTTDGAIESFRVDATTGALSSIETISGLPAGSNGLVGR